MSLPIVITQVSHHKASVTRLVNWINELSPGLEIIVVEITDEEDAKWKQEYQHCNVFANIQAASFRKACDQMEGRAFIWLEPDAIPLKPDWHQQLEDEYFQSGRDILLTSDCYPPDDLIGGIGVYGPHTAKQIPHHFDHTTRAWDHWLIHWGRGLIAFTPLIQHSYGIYANGQVTARRFLTSEGRDFIRKESVIMHRDKFQDLIPRKAKGNNAAKRFLHSGDLGDIIAALPSIRQLGGGHLVLTQSPILVPWSDHRVESLKTLLAEVPYIESVTWEDDPSNIDHDFSTFREIYRHGQDESLAHTQARWLGIENLDTSPWLDISPSEGSYKKVVICRSARYNNPRFPWLKLVHSDRFRRKLIFCGDVNEHHNFQRNFNLGIPFWETPNLKALAHVISGADMLIGNQSCPFWIALGLGKTVIQETCDYQPDSMITRSNAFYSGNGALPPQEWYDKLNHNQLQ